MNYLRKMVQFVRWLTQKRGFTVVLFPGETVQDGRAICDLKKMLSEKEDGIPKGQILHPRIETVAELIEQLKKTDLVVGSRLHSVILAHVLLKPVLAISYHEKINVLMADLNQSNYCLNIDDFEVPVLVERFKVMENELESLQAAIRRRTQAYRRALDQQYENLFGEKSLESSH